MSLTYSAFSSVKTTRNRYSTPSLACSIPSELSYEGSSICSRDCCSRAESSHRIRRPRSSYTTMSVSSITSTSWWMSSNSDDAGSGCDGLIHLRGRRNVVRARLLRVGTRPRDRELHNSPDRLGFDIIIGVNCVRDQSSDSKCVLTNGRQARVSIEPFELRHCLLRDPQLVGDVLLRKPLGFPNPHKITEQAVIVLRQLNGSSKPSFRHFRVLSGLHICFRPAAVFDVPMERHETLRQLASFRVVLTQSNRRISLPESPLQFVQVRKRSDRLEGIRVGRYSAPGNRQRALCVFSRRTRSRPIPAAVEE